MLFVVAAMLGLTFTTSQKAEAYQVSQVSDDVVYIGNQRLETNGKPFGYMGSSMSADNGASPYKSGRANSDWGYHSGWEPAYGKDSYYIEADDGSSRATAYVNGTQSVGIDVSQWQGAIDWNQVKNSGVSWVIMRCGFGNVPDKWETSMDKRFLQNVKGVREAGIPFGVYLYSYSNCLNGFDGHSEGKQTLYYLEKAGISPAELAFPVFYDLEETRGIVASGFAPDSLNQKVTDFAYELGLKGYPTGIYGNLNWWRTRFTGHAFTSYGFTKWVARYPVSTSATSSGFDGTDMWQFTSQAKIPGINGNVDVSFNYHPLGYGKSLDFEFMRKWVKDDRGWKYEMVDGIFVSDRWLARDGCWYYLDADGYMVTGWYFDNSPEYNSWYYFDSSGAMVSNCWMFINNVWYGFWANGKMCIGWVWDSGYNNWFYCDGSGTMIMNAWYAIDGAWYGFESNGEMTRGWSWSWGYNAWFYCDPNSGNVYENGWYRISGTWYYFYPGGYMVSY